MTRSWNAEAVQRQRGVWLNPLLWTLQGWLAMFYIAAGYAKLSEPRNLLITLLTWPKAVSAEWVAAIGVCEILLALGVLTPLISTKTFRPVLLVSAAGLLVDAIAMAGVHAVLDDIGLAAVNLALIAMSATLLWGRGRLNA